MADTLRIGMIGLDTSHCKAFADILNTEEHPHHVSGGTIVRAFPGGSDRLAVSRDRVGGFTTELSESFGVSIVGSLEEAATDVDAVFLTSVDGRQHLKQYAAIAPKGLPVFIDKPFTTSLEEARQIVSLSKQHGSPIMSCSSIRYAAGIAELGRGTEVLGCVAGGPTQILKDFPGLFWYGIHTAEVIFSKMGIGCREVRVTKTDRVDAVTGTWEDGRVATLYGYRFEGVYGFDCTVYTNNGIHHDEAKHDPPYYARMLPEVLEFFRTGRSPIDAQETTEIMAFLAAANRSRDSGKPARLYR